ncbi:hypothetical protein HK096_010470, partial [Nowakowskiella sp. JEL0078]
MDDLIEFPAEEMAGLVDDPEPVSSNEEISDDVVNVETSIPVAAVHIDTLENLFDDPFDPVSESISDEKIQLSENEVSLAEIIPTVPPVPSTDPLGPLDSTLVTPDIFEDLPTFLNNMVRLLLELPNYSDLNISKWIDKVEPLCSRNEVTHVYVLSLISRLSEEHSTSGKNTGYILKKVVSELQKAVERNMEE